MATKVPSDAVPSDDGPSSELASELASDDRGRNPTTGRYHPYERKEHPGKAARKPWVHMFEQCLFPEEELSLGVSQCRPVYQSSLEAYIDRLHAQLQSLGPGFYPVEKEELKALRGIDGRRCKSLIAGLEHDISDANKMLAELKKKNDQLEAALYAPPQDGVQPRSK